jgi:RNA polymerase sigma factor (sigma-70 family)
LMQETICRALEYQDKHKDGIDLAPWLYTIMRNIFINLYRREKRSNKLFHNQADNNQLANREDLSYQLDVGNNVVLSEIGKLPDLFKVPFVLYLEGYKYAEIAEMLCEPIGTIKSRIFFARRILKKTVERN